MSDVLTEDQQAEVNAAFKEVAEETREEVKTEPEALPAAMKGERFPKRSNTITIFPDGVAGEQDQQVEAGLNLLKSALEGAEQAGDEDAIASLKENLETAEAKAAEIRAELLKTGFTFTLRGLPPVIMRGLRREVRAALGISTKGVPEDREEEYEELFAITLVAKQTVRFIDHSESDEPVSLTEEERIAKLREIYDYGDDFQWLRLVNLANDLQFRSTISQTVIESADFS